jgi:hypothetical protein
MSFDMRTLIFAIVVGFCAPAFAAECVYSAPDGRSISFPEPGYMVIRIDDDDRWCQASAPDVERVVECPTDDGAAEYRVTFVEPGLVFDGVLFVGKCTAPGYTLTPPENVF